MGYAVLAWSGISGIQGVGEAKRQAVHISSEISGLTVPPTYASSRPPTASLFLFPLLRCIQAAKVAQQRFLNLHEYQSKELLHKHGCTVQNFIVASDVDEAREKLKRFEMLFEGDIEYVVKAQILAGGRGKGHFIGGDDKIRGVFITLE
ncbi:unnamed protein product [Cylicostephanus goldi]|uniref:ATP-grasp fold succinyl-CoA synthetase-type domain-containing protein n=1 Tax=Cylicostephanus goldi TaxID=71465 RepID=A0A3P6QUG6_CYLGO|nr:unnamed protein product [Cylicostephanus goldi]